MPSRHDRRARVLGTSRQPAASWMAGMLSTAAWLVGRRVHPSSCRRRAVQAEARGGWRAGAGERDRVVGGGVDVATAAHWSEDDRVRLVRAGIVRAGLVERRGGGTVHRALEKAGELDEGLMGDVKSGVQARQRRLGDQKEIAVGI